MSLRYNPEDFIVEMYDITGDDILRKPVVDYYVDDLEWSAIGGPTFAKIRAKGSEYALWELPEHLMRKFVIKTPTGIPVWWGFSSEMVIYYGTVRVSISLDPMYNSVQVVYVKKTGSGLSRSKAETTWVSNSDSVGRYGTKKYRLSISEATDEEALNQANTTLNWTKYPVPLTSFMSTETEEPYAEVYLEGIWGTLGWDYYSSNKGSEVYTDLGDGVQEVGEVTGNQYVGQQFEISSAEGWDAKYIHVRARREGSPTDYFRIELCQDNAGVPGTVIQYTDILGSSMSDSYNWVIAELPALVSLSPSTKYWVVCRRSGAVNATNYYLVDVNEELGYTNGYFRIYTGSGWVARSPNADMNFTVIGSVESSEKLGEILNTSGFLTSVAVEDNSGVYVSPYEEGDVTMRRLVETLLDRGTSNDLRLLAWINEGFLCTIFEEPAKPLPGEAGYHIYADGTVTDYLDKPLSEGQIPVGVWGTLKDVLPISYDVLSIADATSVFIEGAKYTGALGRLQIIPRGIPRILDLQRGIL